MGHPCVVQQLAHYGRCFIAVIFVSYFDFFGVVIREFCYSKPTGGGIDVYHTSEFQIK